MMTDSDEQKPTNYTGVVVGAIMVAVLIVFQNLGNYELGLSVSICTGMTIFAIILRWDLRRKPWFWGVIALISAIHVPLVLMVPWPLKTFNRLSLLPIALADLLIILGPVYFVEKFIVKASPSDDEEAL